MPDLSTMPKAELHLHLEGSFRWSTLQEAMLRHHGKGLPATPSWYHSGHRFHEFGEFLRLFQDYVDPWLSTPTGYREILRDVVEGLWLQNVRYAEINFSLGLVERIGHPLERVLEWLQSEAELAHQQGLEIRFFAGINRHRGSEQALKWTQQVCQASIVTGIDLHGNEVGWPASLFETAFQFAQEHGKRVKVHAGEMVGPQAIRDAVGLNITQIGHGTSASQDPELMERLRDRQVLLELCPTSNERLLNIPSYKAHPIFALDQAGIPVTLNSDDSAFFGINLTQEMHRLMAERQASISDLKRWTTHAFKKAAIDSATRQAFLLELEAWTPSDQQMIAAGPS